jgi:uncharacterized protein (TIGR02453 family)
MAEMRFEGGFRGFSADSFRFFRDLAENNNKHWFDLNRGRYDEHVAGAFRGLLAELEPFLLELNSNFETAGKTNRNFSRINRDIRFSKDKSPYKPNYYLYVFDRRGERGDAGRLYVGLSADCVTVGFSIYGDGGRRDTSALKTVFRKRLETHDALFQRLAGKILTRRRYETYWHRQEKGEWTLHSGLPKRAEDWQTLQAWIVRRVFQPNARGLAAPGFAREVSRIFSELYPLFVFTSVTSPRWRVELRKWA